MSEQDLRSLYPEELAELAVSCGDRSFRGGQLFEWIHGKQVLSIDDASNIPKKLKSDLKNSGYYESSVRLVDCRISQRDGTRKYLFALGDGNVIETVLMRQSYGNSVCISSQVGCRMGCRFCASTVDGLVRNLTAGEMLLQIYSVQRDIGERIGHVVVMGSGEPLDNYDSLLRFLKILCHPKGMNLSLRNVTVSTCGIVPRMYELAKERLQLTLAVSLHASTQEKRRRIMPVANAYAIEDVIRAAGDYFQETGRRISFEYTLIAGVNDGPEDAAELIGLLRGGMKNFPHDCHVNLIPVNPVTENNFAASGKNETLVLANKLEKSGINVTIRKEMGRDIDGACGQLRRRFLEGQNE